MPSEFALKIQAGMREAARAEVAAHRAAGRLPHPAEQAQNAPMTEDWRKRAKAAEARVKELETMLGQAFEALAVLSRALIWHLEKNPVEEAREGPDKP